MAQSFNTWLPDVAVRYARLVGIRISGTTLKRELEENPYYPSLLSLSDTFDRYGVQNAAYEVDEEHFGELEAPFVAYARTKDNVRDFILVTKTTGDSVTFVREAKRPVTVSLGDFLKDYKKIVWMAEPGEHSGEKDFEAKMAAEKTMRVQTGVMIGLAALAFLGLVLANTGLPGMDAGVVFWIALLTKTVGLTTSILLLLYESGNAGDFVKHICQANTQTDCGAVLHSKAATIWGITWSEAGFYYFAASLSGLLFPGLPFAEKAWLLCWGAFPAACYVPFSIYYQWRVVKQWCPLCLTIQAVLVAECVWAVLLLRHGPLVQSISALPAVFFCVVWPPIVLFFLKPLLHKAKDGDQYRSAFRRLRANPELFQGLLQQQPVAPDGLEGLGIVLGNPDAPIRITKVCNPYCQPCADAHPLLEELLERNRNIQLRMVFTARNVENDRKTPVVKHFLALAARRDSALLQKALDDWYGAPKKDYEDFAKKYPLREGEGQSGAEIDAMSGWCDKAEVAYTPTIYVNGYRLPEDYSARELMEIF
jgi:uncharacterized membrane protein